MASTAVRGHGTKLRKVSGTSSTLIAQILDIDGPESEADEIDFSNMDSTNRRREFFAGMVDEGEVSFELVFAKAQFTAAKALVGGNTTTSFNDSFEIELTDRTSTAGTGSIIAFGGFVKGLGVAIPFEDKVTCPATIKLSGEVTFTASS